MAGRSPERSQRSPPNSQLTPVLKQWFDWIFPWAPIGCLEDFSVTALEIVLPSTLMPGTACQLRWLKNVQTLKLRRPPHDQDPYWPGPVPRDWLSPCALLAGLPKLSCLTLEHMAVNFSSGSGTALDFWHAAFYQ